MIGLFYEKALTKKPLRKSPCEKALTKRALYDVLWSIHICGAHEISQYGGVATVSRIDKIICLFCRIMSLLRKPPYKKIPVWYIVVITYLWGTRNIAIWGGPYRALLQKRPIILSILLTEATPYVYKTYAIDAIHLAHAYKCLTSTHLCTIGQMQIKFVLEPDREKKCYYIVSQTHAVD